MPPTDDIDDKIDDGTPAAIDDGTPADADTDGTPASDSDGTPAVETNPFDAFPENWRDIWAGGDEKRRAQLDRVNDVEALAGIYWNGQTQLSKSRPDLPGEDATDEQWSAYREAHNIPTDGVYEFAPELLGDDGKFAEYEKPYIDAIAKAAYEHHIPSDAVNAIAGAMKAAQSSMNKAYAEMDAANEQNTKQALEREWGSDAKSNFNLIEALMNRMPEQVRDAIRTARGADGGMLKDNAAVQNALAGIAREVMPGGARILDTERQHGGVDARIAEIEKMITDDPDAYYKNNEVRKEYGDLLEARDQMRQSA